MNETATPSSQFSIFGNEHEQGVLTDNWKHSSRKNMRSLLIISLLFLVADIAGLSKAGLLDTKHFLYSLPVPLLFAGLAILALKQPFAAIILGVFLFIGLGAVSVCLLGTVTLISGWLFKAIMVFFLLNGFHSAREAEEARKKLAAIR